MARLLVSEPQEHCQREPAGSQLAPFKDAVPETLRQDKKQEAQWCFSESSR